MIVANLKRPRSQLLLVLVVAVSVSMTCIAHGQLIVAHRGASHDAPENTLAAFRLAFEQGADGIEGDFRVTADNRIVCIHDEDTERVATRKLLVAESTVAELRRLDVGSWKGEQWKGERIPTLEEVIAVVPPGKKFLIELKAGPEIVPPLKQVIESARIARQQCVIICFKTETLLKCRECLPDLETHWLTGHEESKQQKGVWEPSCATVIEKLKSTGSDGLGSEANTNVFDAIYIDKLKQAGLRTFHVWTVDEVATARFYQRWGVWGITTNRPAFIRAGLEAARIP